MEILSIILFLISLIVLYLAYQIKITKTNQQNEIKRKIEIANKEYQTLEKQVLQTREKSKDKRNYLSELDKQIDNKVKNLLDLEEKQKNIEKNIDTSLANKKQNLDKLYNELKSNSENAFFYYEKVLDQQYKKIQADYENQVEKIGTQKQYLLDDLAQIKKSYDAAAAAKIRQQEDNTKLSFYKIQLSEKQLADIIKLSNIQSQLFDPSIVSKAIWSSYIMKPTNEMCKRVLETSSPVCGVYKITNKKTDEIYIGQSVNIADRWKNHIKCGLGIDASSTNTLYNNMQETGVWNFTFELLEKCSREKLNEKERFWIDMYSSNKVGLNMTKGVTTHTH